MISSSVKERRHLPALDGLRGVAILLVIAYHCHQLQSGWAGVDLFFVLSGFLITGILERSKHAPDYFRNFLGRRALRILPPYVLYLSVILILLPSLGTIGGGAGHWWVWSYLTNVRLAVTGDWQSVPPFTEHLWSVAVEEQFYLLWPILVWRFATPTLRRVCLGAMLAALSIRIALVADGVNDLAPYMLVFTRMDSLMIGAWLALSRVRPGPWWTLVATACLIALLVASVPPGNIAMMTAGYTAIAVASAVLVAACLELAPVARMLEWAPLRLAGRYSYTAYLIHPIVIAQLREHVSPHYSRRLALLVVVVTFTIAAASWAVFEKPILSLKRYFPEPRSRIEEADPLEQRDPRPVA